MVIQIAFGIFLGFLLIICLFIFIFLVSAFLIREHDRFTEEDDVVIAKKKPRPKRANESPYEEMQRIKKNAKEANPKHWEV